MRAWSLFADARYIGLARRDPVSGEWMTRYLNRSSADVVRDLVTEHLQVLED